VSGIALAIYINRIIEKKLGNNESSSKGADKVTENIIMTYDKGADKVTENIDIIIDVLKELDGFVLALLILKPLIFLILRRCLGLANRSYFTKRLFRLRLAFDFIILFASVYLMYKKKEEKPISEKDFLSLNLPLLIVQPLLFCFSIRPADRKARKVKYRIMKHTIQTQ